MEKSERFDGESRFVNMEGFLPWRRRSHRTRNCVKERKRYGSLNRNEFRREEDDDVSLDLFEENFGGHEIRVPWVFHHRE